MKLFVVALLLGVAFAMEGITRDPKDALIEGEYLVIFKSGITDEIRATHMKAVALMSETIVKHEFSIGDFNGYSLKTSLEGILQLSELDEVDFVEQNQRYYVADTQAVDDEVAPVYNLFQPHAACVQQKDTPSWGLTRTQERPLNLNGLYRYADNAGAGVVVYVVDTGIYVEHPDFQGRAVWGTDTADNPPVFQDNNGHGTHVAGTCISKSYGLARAATAVAVKVLGKDGSGSTDGVIAGVNWAVRDHKSRGTGRSVANMSLGGGFSQAMNNAVAAAVKQGVAFAVAAGNDGGGIIPSPDACKHSPASEPLAITVGATDSTDSRATYSNYGACVKIFGPGTGITSLWIPENGQKAPIKTISGTSMATPHVAGVLLKLWSANPELKGDGITKLLYDLTTNDVVKDPKKSANKLVFESCTSI